MSAIDYSNLRRMPTGRHRYYLRQTRRRAEKADLPEVVEKTDRGLEQGRVTAAIEMRWKQPLNQSRARGNASEVLLTLNEQFRAIFNRIESDVVGDDTSPRVQAARKIKSTLFSDGYVPLNQLSFEEADSTTTTIMDLLDGELAASVLAIGMTDHVERFRRLNVEFSQELDASEDNTKLTFDVVKAARTALHLATCKVVVAIHYHLDGEDPETVKLRDHLLAPLVTQQQLVARSRHHDRITDVDPETGEELDEEFEGFEDTDVEFQTDDSLIDQPDEEPSVSDSTEPAPVVEPASLQ